MTFTASRCATSLLAEIPSAPLEVASQFCGHPTDSRRCWVQVTGKDDGLELLALGKGTACRITCPGSAPEPLMVPAAAVRALFKAATPDRCPWVGVHGGPDAPGITLRALGTTTGKRAEGPRCGEAGWLQWPLLPNQPHLGQTVVTAAGLNRALRALEGGRTMALTLLPQGLLLTADAGEWRGEVLIVGPA
ncbi:MULTISPECIES: hypothetical protein [Aphanothece]|uniref:hypothetical protein n=1 Tax=Aphanothece TaxID=1121 RepID=UPI003984F13D